MLKILTKQENMSRKVCFACSLDAREILQMSCMENPQLWNWLSKKTSLILRITNFIILSKNAHFTE